MDEIKLSPNASLLTSFSSKTFAQTRTQKTASDDTPVFTLITTADGYQVSGESQYVFELDIYLSTLEKDEQAKAIDFLSKSDNPLHAKVLESFYRSEEFRRTLTDDVIKSIREQGEAAAAKFPKPVPRDPSLGPEIGIIPSGAAVYKLDGQKDYYPFQSTTPNTALLEQLEKLEANPPANLNIQEKVDIFGTVRNALYTSQNIFQSFDDVLHFNYTMEKARTTIDQIKAPEDLKTKLKDLLNQGMAFQNTQQNNFLESVHKYVNNDRVGNIARENLRLGIAAQAYNIELQRTLAATKLSVLNAGSLMTNLLMKHTDLIRFTPEKINDALNFYRNDFNAYKDLLINGYKPPEEKPYEFDQRPINEGHSYALKVIAEIQNYNKHLLN